MREYSTAVTLIAAAALCMSALGAVLRPAQVWAQTGDDVSPAEQRTAAAEAYDNGTAAFLSGDYEKAARWFETAHRMAPAPASMIQAVRSHEKAGNLARAGTLALRLQNEYPNEANAVEYAEQVLSNIRGDYFQVEVECAGCDIELDGTLQEGRAFLLEPGTPHRIIAHFDAGDVHREIQGEAGESLTLELEAPARSAEAEVQPKTGARVDFEPRAQEEEHDVLLDGPLPPLATYIAGGVTLAVGGVLAWSSVDTVSGVDTYDDAAAQCMVEDSPECDRARELLEEGQDKELRTNVLIGATAAAAAGTLVIALFFTDWSGEQEHADPSPRVRGGVVPLASGGATAIVEGRF